MSTNPIKVTPIIKGQKAANLLEKIGVTYFSNLSKKLKYEHDIHLKDVPSDKVLQVVVNNITINAIIIALLVGGLTTVPAVWFEMYYQNSFSTFNYYTILFLITTLLLIVEITVLYWVGMKSTYTLAQILGYDEKHIDNGLPTEYDIKKMMVRSALEIEDPTIEYLGINPHKNISKKWLAISAIFYKAKVMLTGIIIKILIRKVAARYGVRVGLIWVAIPVTAIWDAIVMHTVIKDAKLRLFGHHLSKYIIEELITDELIDKYSPNIGEGAIRAVSTIMVISGNYHPNNIILLIRLSKNFNISESKDYDDLNKFLQYLNKASQEERHFLRILAGVSAVFNGKIKRAKKDALIQIFGEKKDKYMNFIKDLQSLLLNSKLHQSAKLCKDEINTTSII